MFETFIRNSRMGPGDMRELGVLAYEYETAATQAPRWFEDRSARRYSRSANGLAEDYQALINEILAAFTARRAAESSRSSGSEARPFRLSEADGPHGARHAAAMIRLPGVRGDHINVSSAREIGRGVG